MKDFISKYLSEESWQIIEDEWNKKQQNVWETNFCLGNGYIGSRGIYEEIPQGCYPGTYINGLYDNTNAQVTELVNLPNPIDFRLSIDGEKVAIDAMEYIEHKRILDIKKGLLARRTLFKNTRQERFDYQSLRFFSMKDLEIGVMRIYFTALDAPCLLTVCTVLDLSIKNKGVLTEGDKMHFQPTEVSASRSINYQCIKTFEEGIFVAYADVLFINKSGKLKRTSERIFTLELNKGETVCFTKIFSVCMFSAEPSPKKIKTLTIDKLKKTSKKGFDRLLKESLSVWQSKWDIANIEIENAKDLETALKFNIYHLIIATNEKLDNCSIGAKTLSGEGYRGHVFWDTEIFIFPFVVHTNPSLAKKLILYRYKRLDAARKNAELNGYRGAQFPWESADKGNEVTPEWFKDLDGSLIQIYTMKNEHHITADVTYAVVYYFQATKDIDFMLNYGLEILFETARFWASRVEYNPRRKCYEIKRVMGPDEFHKEVDNNAYTNFMASWNLRSAVKFYHRIKETHPEKLNKLNKKIKLKENEVKEWGEISSKLIFPVCKKRNLIRAFDGYFRKKDIEIEGWDKYFMPLFPKKVSLSKIDNTQLVKQPDVLMLFHLFPDRFTKEEKRRNFEYYESRTLHKSSLSPSIHAIISLDIGKDFKGHQYYYYTLFTDLRDFHGNTADGIHAASAGGSWQATIFGFAGMKIEDGVLSFDPKIPVEWGSLKFKLIWEKKTISFSVYPNKMEVAIKPENPVENSALNIKIYHRMRKVWPGKPVTFYKRGGRFYEEKGL